MLGGEVVQLGAVDVGVVQLPLVVVEVAPAGERRVVGDGLPAVVPDRPRAEHRVELRRPRRRRRRVVEAVAHAHAVEGALHVALDRRRAARRRARRGSVGHEVDRVVVLLADLAPRLHPGRPRDDARVARAAVELVALPHLERRVERHRPAVRVVVVRLRAAELVEQRQVGLDVVGDAVDELHLVDRAVRAALAARAVVGDEDHERVLAPAELLEEVEQPADLVVGVREEAGVDLGHPGEEPLLVVRERVPRPRHVQRRERLAVGPGARLGRADRVDRRQLGVGRDEPELLLAGERLLAHRLVAHVERPLYLSIHSFGAWCGAWHAPGA